MRVVGKVDGSAEETTLRIHRVNRDFFFNSFEKLVLRRLEAISIRVAPLINSLLSFY